MELTGNSVRSYVAPAVPRRSPLALGTKSEKKRPKRTVELRDTRREIRYTVRHIVRISDFRMKADDISHSAPLSAHLTPFLESPVSRAERGRYTDPFIPSNALLLCCLLLNHNFLQAVRPIADPPR